MVMRKAFLALSRCNACHFTLLNNFASVAGIPLRPAVTIQSRQSWRKTLNRGFASSRLQSSDSLQHNESSRETPIGDTATQEGTTTDNASSTTQDPVPWYLQIPTLQPVTSPLSERQKLPELPENPPVLLQPLLEHISIDIGLDDLTLLDLRNLDPPPALGANLLMVIGTARSEKHLHVSADRFCRWLRTNYKLKPYADGLLGRNELKLKLRRKARRAKLLGSVGSSETGNPDDGIRTGWVCVNVGVIAEVEGASEEDMVADGFVGFGGLPEGVKLVVQMLTEEKREELDLESLWGGFLRRQRRKAEREAEKSLLEKEEEVGSTCRSGKIPIADLSPLTANSPTIPTRHLLSQRRCFHTSTRHDGGNVLERGARTAENQETVLEPSVKNMESSEHDSDERHRNLFDKTIHSLGLRGLVEYLETLNDGDIITALGKGAQDFSSTSDFGSTSFLTAFNHQIPLFPETHHWQCRFDLINLALRVNHPGYSAIDVLNLLRQMQMSATTIPASILESVFSTLANHASELAAKSDNSQLSPEAVLDLLIELMEEMSLRSHEILNEAICVNLLKVLTKIFLDTGFQDDSRIRKHAIVRFVRVLDKKRVHFTRVESHLQILTCLSSSEHWVEYWRHWRGMARRMQRRSAELYAMMFRQIARTRHRSHCINALRDWVPEMDIEQPKVLLSPNLARAIIECVRVAEPSIDRLVRNTNSDKGEWTKLYRRCWERAGMVVATPKITQQELEDNSKVLNDIDDL